jgi:triosephosphate isomerase
MKQQTITSPFILINLKAYQESIGRRAHAIAAAAEQVSEESGIMIGICPMYMDIHPINHHYNIPVFAQHIAPIKDGAYTGMISAHSVRMAGACGSLINHSENRQTLADIEHCVRLLREENMWSCVCTNNVASTHAASAYNPDFVAIEPPELIGSGISVSKANPDIIKESVAAAKSISPTIRVLTGAGISTGQCVKTALDLGSDGVLLASGVVKASDPEAVLRDLISLIK